MATQRVRFLHTSDWHLEEPIGGVVEVPAGLREPWVDAPFQAADRVVQAALDEQVDFLLLAGNALTIESACPYTFEFLLRQFQRLGDAGITVYWLGGPQDDLDLWPAQLELPDNVRTFPVGTMQTLEHIRDGRCVASIIGQSWHREGTWRASDYAGSDDGVPRVAAGLGKVSKRWLENKGVQYWALGGLRRHRIVNSQGTQAAYAGSPQGRKPADDSIHGAVLVDIERDNVTTRLIETDVWRWRNEKLAAGDLQSVEALRPRLVQHLKQLGSPSPRCGWLIVWTVACHGQLAATLQIPDAVADLLESLHNVFEDDSIWSVTLESEPAEVAAERFEEDTILGDFLRSVRRLEREAVAWHELTDYLPEGDLRDTFSQLLQHEDEASRQLLWRRVASWGADLLQGNTAVDAIEQA